MTQEEFVINAVEKYRDQGLPDHMIEDAVKEDWVHRYGDRANGKLKTILKKIL